MPKVTQQAAKPAPKKKGGSVVDRIQSASDFCDTGIKLVAYGKGGSGKTTFISTWPKPLLHIVCSGAGESRSIRNVPGVYVVKLEDEEELNTLMDDESITTKYRTLCLDHVTGFRDLVLKKVTGLTEVPQQLSWGVASQEQWGAVTAGVKDRIHKLFNVPNHVVIVAQERTFNVEESIVDIISPYTNADLNPGIVSWLGYNVDYLVQTFIRPKTVEKDIDVAGQKIKQRVPTGGFEFCLRTGVHDVFMTKFRVPRGTKLPDVIVDPTFEKLQKIIQG